MNPHLTRSPAAGALALALFALVLEPSAAAAQSRLGQAWDAIVGRGAAAAAGEIQCTVVAGPVDAGPTSREADVLCLDTTIEMRTVWIRFSAGDRPRVDRHVGLGALVRVRNGSALVVDGEAVIQANRWGAKRGGDPSRADFLRMDASRLPLLAWSLRDRPDVARHFAVNLDPVAEELRAVYDLLVELGHDVPGLEVPSPTVASLGAPLRPATPPPAPPPPVVIERPVYDPDPALLACRTRLRQVGVGLEEVARVLEAGEVISGLATVHDLVGAVDDHFRAYPAVGVR